MGIKANALKLPRFGSSAVLASILILFGCSVACASGAENFWGCLIYASNGGQCNCLPDRLNGYDKRMSRAFGYSRFCVIAQRQKALQAQKETGLIFSDDLRVVLVSMSNVSEDQYLISLLVVEGAKPIMETQARVSRDSPLFIRGPDWRDGQIIIVVMVAA
jgi:hypothetical protein